MDKKQMSWENKSVELKDTNKTKTTIIGTEVKIQEIAGITWDKFSTDYDKDLYNTLKQGVITGEIRNLEVQ